MNGIATEVGLANDFQLPWLVQLFDQLLFLLRILDSADLLQYFWLRRTRRDLQRELLNCGDLEGTGPLVLLWDASRFAIGARKRYILVYQPQAQELLHVVVTLRGLAHLEGCTLAWRKEIEVAGLSLSWLQDQRHVVVYLSWRYCRLKQRLLDNDSPLRLVHDDLLRRDSRHLRVDVLARRREEHARAVAEV